MSSYTKITAPCAWRASDFSGQIPLTALTDDVKASVDQFVHSDAFRTLPVEQLARKDFESPAMKSFMDQCQKEILQGRGFVLLDGLDASRYTDEQMEKIYWIFGLHLGDPVSQSAAGQMMGHVADKPDVGPSGRGYHSRQLLPMHTDGGDYMGLMCVRPAKSGGMSVVSSIATIYNEFVDKAPHLLPILFRGFKYHRREEQREGTAPSTPYYVPVFVQTSMGLLSHYVRASIDLYGRDFEPLSAIEIEALDTFDQFASAAETCLEFFMQPGQMYLCNNAATLHSRSHFEDWDEVGRKRLLYRLWLQGNPRWDAPATLYVYENADGRAGVDSKPGGKPAGANFFVDYDKYNIGFRERRSEQEPQSM